MAEQGFRPRYKFFVPQAPEVILRAITTKANEQNPDRIIVRKAQDHMVLDIPNEDRHFWSPHMDLNVERDEALQSTLVRCLIGPSPTVWTMFMFFYGLFGFVGFIGLMLGMSQWTLNKAPWGLWFVPLAMIGIGLMYYISYKGKALSRAEMMKLKTFIDDALGCDCLALADEQLNTPNNLAS